MVEHEILSKAWWGSSGSVCHRRLATNTHTDMHTMGGGTVSGGTIAPAGPGGTSRPNMGLVKGVSGFLIVVQSITQSVYSHFRNYAPPLDEKGGIITEKVFPVFSERVFRACFGLVI